MSRGRQRFIYQVLHNNKNIGCTKFVNDAIVRRYRRPLVDCANPRVLSNTKPPSVVGIFFFFFLYVLSFQCCLNLHNSRRPSPSLSHTPPFSTVSFCLSLSLFFYASTVRVVSRVFKNTWHAKKYTATVRPRFESNGKPSSTSKVSSGIRGTRIVVAGPRRITGISLKETILNYCYRNANTIPSETYRNRIQAVLKSVVEIST